MVRDIYRPDCYVNSTKFLSALMDLFLSFSSNHLSCLEVNCITEVAISVLFLSQQLFWLNLSIMACFWCVNCQLLWQWQILVFSCNFDKVIVMEYFNKILRFQRYIYLNTNVRNSPKNHLLHFSEYEMTLWFFVFYTSPGTMVKKCIQSDS